MNWRACAAGAAVGAAATAFLGLTFGLGPHQDQPTRSLCASTSPATMNESNTEELKVTLIRISLECVF